MIRRILRSNSSARIAVVVCALVPLLMAREVNAQAELTVPAGLPDWAFNIPDKVQPTAVRVDGIVKAPGSTKEYEWAKVAGTANPPDWFPDEHAAAPRAVTGGPGIRFACGACHLMSGQGHPEAADIAGMPAEYLIRQMAYYKTGARKDDARMGPIAKVTSDEDVREAAEYFAALKPSAFLKRSSYVYAIPALITPERIYLFTLKPMLGWILLFQAKPLVSKAIPTEAYGVRVTELFQVENIAAPCSK